MKQTKHTPGPWFRDETDDTIFVLNDVSDVVASIERNTVGIEDCEANAQLIAAAPDLLEGLELAKAYIGSIQGHADIHNATALYLKLGEAIAKARGES